MCQLPPLRCCFSPPHIPLPNSPLTKPNKCLFCVPRSACLNPPKHPYCLHPALTPACTPFLSHSRSSSPSARQGFSCICPHPGTGPTPTVSSSRGTRSSQLPPASDTSHPHVHPKPALSHPPPIRHLLTQPPNLPLLPLICPPTQSPPNFTFSPDLLQRKPRHSRSHPIVPQAQPCAVRPLHSNPHPPSVLHPHPCSYTATAPQAHS